MFNEKIRKINQNWVFETKKLNWIAKGITEKKNRYLKPKLGQNWQKNKQK